MFKRRGNGIDRHTLHLDVDVQGPVDKNARVCLHLAPGSCLLRALDVSAMSAKEIEPALALLAEASLPLAPEQYYLDSWTIGPKRRGLVACPRQPLAQARRRLQAAGARAVAVRVPELRPPLDPRPALVLWATPTGVLACLWRDQALYHWQSFPSSLPQQAIVEQLAVAANPVPQLIYLSWMRTELDPWTALAEAWPRAEVVEIWDWDAAERERRFGSGLGLSSFLLERQRQPADRGDKLRLGLALSGVLCAGLFMFFAEVGYLERQAEQLRHQVSLLKVRAQRSEKVAARSGQTLRQIRELKALTVERRGILEVLKTLTDTLPARVKLDRISVERGGASALDGVAETELDISNFLRQLGQTPLLNNPRLTFTQRQDAEGGGAALIRFQLEARLAQPLLTLPGDAAGAPAPGAADTGDES